jgi:hypothetical protein
MTIKLTEEQLEALQQSPDKVARMRAEAAIELAYGLLWLMPQVDLDRAEGWLAHKARMTLLGQLGRDGQARGIEAAKPILAAKIESRKNSRTEHPYLANALEFRGKSDPG